MKTWKKVVVLIFLILSLIATLIGTVFGLSIVASVADSEEPAGAILALIILLPIWLIVAAVSVVFGGIAFGLSVSSIKSVSVKAVFEGEIDDGSVSKNNDKPVAKVNVFALVTSIISAVCILLMIAVIVILFAVIGANNGN